MKEQASHEGCGDLDQTPWSFPNAVFKNLTIFNYVYKRVCVSECRCPWRLEALGLPGVALRESLSHVMLGTELESSKRVLCFPNENHLSKPSKVVLNLAWVLQLWGCFQVLTSHCYQWRQGHEDQMASRHGPARFQKFLLQNFQCLYGTLASYHSEILWINFLFN